VFLSFELLIPDESCLDVVDILFIKEIDFHLFTINNDLILFEGSGFN